MSLAEIIEELPKLTPEERRTIYQQIETLDGAPSFEPTSEMLDAIEEGTRSILSAHDDESSFGGG
jgi:hypothetical protein